MQLILLSGGSGVRLWPLSNSTRSKQFLPILEDRDGKVESMIQRVVRQFRENNTTHEITIATNESQLGCIINQLGDEVSIVSEPLRRDTFPAIALAVSYLKYVKQCPDDEVVVVMPCDTYADNSYFEAIDRMVSCVNQNIANLVLMGIKPTYPSEKYGYIVPCSDFEKTDINCQKVDKFTEKPSIEYAKQLIENHAYWNGGVFAFRVGYIIDIVKHYIASDCFDDIRNRYLELPKISFDYEVVEKEKSVAVVSYSGKWKDLGTWNTLTEELSSKVRGNVFWGPHCSNTHIINELKLPIYVDGVDNCIVAAAPDGILVCNKEYTEELKSRVEKITVRPMYEEKSWGSCRVLDYSTHLDGSSSLTMHVIVNKGKEIISHKHLNYSEVWTFLDGEGKLFLGDETLCVKKGDAIVISSNQLHGVEATSQLTFIAVKNGLS